MTFTQNSIFMLKYEYLYTRLTAEANTDQLTKTSCGIITTVFKCHNNCSCFRMFNSVSVFTM